MADHRIFTEQHWIAGVGEVVPDVPDTPIGAYVHPGRFVETAPDVYAILNRLHGRVISSGEVSKESRAAVATAIDIRLLFAWNDDEAVGDRSDIFLVKRGIPIDGSSYTSAGHEYIGVEHVAPGVRVEVPVLFMPFWEMFDYREALSPSVALDRLADVIEGEPLYERLRTAFDTESPSRRVFLTDVFTGVFLQLLKLDLLRVEGY